MKQLNFGDIHLTHLQIIWTFITNQIVHWSVGEPYMGLQCFAERLGVYLTFLKQIYSQKVLLKIFNVSFSVWNHWDTNMIVKPASVKSAQSSTSLSGPSHIVLIQVKIFKTMLWLHCWSHVHQACFTLYNQDRSKKPIIGFPQHAEQALELWKLTPQVNCLVPVLRSSVGLCWYPVAAPLAKTQRLKRMLSSLLLLFWALD